MRLGLALALGFGLGLELGLGLGLGFAMLRPRRAAARRLAPPPTAAAPGVTGPVGISGVGLGPTIAASAATCAEGMLNMLEGCCSPTN